METAQTGRNSIAASGGYRAGGLPDEPICEVGRETQKQVARAGFKNVLTVGLANDYLGYMVEPANLAD